MITGKLKVKQHGECSWAIMSGDIVLAAFKREDNLEHNQANAQELVKRWNCHEELLAVIAKYCVGGDCDKNGCQIQNPNYDCVKRCYLGDINTILAKAEN